MFVLDAREGHDNEWIMWSDSTKLNLLPDCILAQVPLAARRAEREKTVSIFDQVATSR